MRMYKYLMLLALCGLSAQGAEYRIKANPGDTVIVEVPNAGTPTPEPIPTPEPVPVPPVNTIGVGVNLPGPDEWNLGARAKLFVDVMKTAREIAPNRWRVLTTSNNQAQELNWSTSGSRQPKIAGTYLLSWDGGGTVTASGATIRNFLTVGTADVVVSSDSVDVDLQFSAPVKNIRLIRPGYTRATTQTVTNEFKAYIAPFAYIRTMDLQITNWADEADAAARFASLGADKRMDWRERPAANAQTYHSLWGVPIEAIVQIANETKKNPWICIPWCATDDYLTGLAIYLKANLDPSLTATFEWGNELWNYAYGFFHSGLFRAEAAAYAAAGTAPKLANPADNDYYYAGRYAVKRTIDAATIFKAQGVNARAVIASQFANPSFVADALNWALRSYPNPPSYYIAGIACAPYYGAGTGTQDEIIAALKKDIATRQANDSKLMWWRAVADAYQVKLYMYEAGCDMGQSTANLTNKIATAYDSRMADVTKLYLESCYFDAGTEALMYFNGISTRDKWGPAWALTDDAVDLQQPMYAGAKAFAMQAAPSGGLTATFYKDSNFTTPLGTITVPVVNHRWQSWSTGGLWGRKDVTSTQAVNGSIRFTGRYVGAGTLTAEKEANDTATLTRNGDKLTLDYVARFDGNGTAWVRLMADGKPVRQSQLLPN